MQMFDYAVVHASKGHHVFPAHSVILGLCTCRNPECTSPGKHPLIKGWREKATINTDQIRIWWDEWPWANIGIATGGISELIVLDVDVSTTKNGPLSLANLEARYHALPSTYTVRTGSGGLHYYFAANSIVLRNSAGRLGEGLDIRSEGGFVIAPPSLHVSGNRYIVECKND